MPQIIKSPRFQIDLLEVVEHISKDNPDAADRLLSHVEDRLKLLASNPLTGEARPDLPGQVRSVSLGNYVIIFRPAVDGIQLVRILHGARDVKKLL